MNLKGILQDKSNGMKLMLFVILIVISFVLCQLFIVALSLIGVIPIDIFLGTSTKNQNDILFLKVIQLISFLFLFIIPSVVFSYLEHKKNIFKRMGFTNFGSPKMKLHSRISYIVKMILLISAMTFCIQPFIYYTYELNTYFITFLDQSYPDYFSGVIGYMRDIEESTEYLMTDFLKMPTIFDLTFNLFLIAIIPAIAEEMLFRGVLQQKLKAILKNHHIAIIITALIFSAIHMQFFGFLPRFFLGILLGYLFYYSGNLWMSVLFHFLNNAIIILVYFAFNSDNLITSINLEINNIVGFSGLLSACIVLILLYSYKQIGKEISKIN